jgi:protocatechuate 3,4-dioxygenase beta subunit
MNQMMRPLIVVGTLTLATMAGYAGQLPRPAAGSGVIAGRVIDAQTGAPIPGATVRLSQTRSPAKARLGYSHTTSDASGRFAFQSLPEGQFSLTSTATNYLEGKAGKRRERGYEQWVSLRTDQVVETLTIEMTRAARITGNVRNERGEPVADLRVHAWPREVGYRPDWPVPRTYSAPTTKDGDYVLDGISPGDYVVLVPVQHSTFRAREGEPEPCAFAAPPSQPSSAADRGAAMRAAPARAPGTLFTELPRGLAALPASKDGRQQTYATTYFPGETEPDRALPTHLESGDTRTGVNLQLKTVPAVTVRGHLVRRNNAVIGDATAVTLRRSDAMTSRPDDVFDAQAVRDPDGAFTFLDVPAGRYVLEVTLKHSLGCHTLGSFVGDVITRMPVDIPPEGLDRLDVPIAEGLVIRGRVVYQEEAIRPRLLHVRAAEAQGVSRAGTADAATFEVRGLTSGRWFLAAEDNAENSAWSVGSITLDGRDLTLEPVVVGATDVSGVVLTMTTKGASVNGTVSDETGRQVDDATVVVFPADRRLWLDAHPRMLRFKTERALLGVYRFSSIMPGDYFFAAVDERRMDDWPALKFLESIAAGASRVRIASGELRTLPLKIK